MENQNAADQSGGARTESAGAANLWRSPAIPRRC